LIGNTTSLTTAAASIPSATLYIPLQFWLKSTLTKKRELNSFSELIIFILICNTYKLLETPKVLDTPLKRKLFKHSKNSKNVTMDNQQPSWLFFNQKVQRLNISGNNY